MKSISLSGWEIFYRITHVIGFLSVIVCAGVTVETLYFRQYIGIYFVCLTLVVAFFESVTIINIFIPPLSRRKPSVLLFCWRCCSLIDTWKKAILYVILSVPCFIHPKSLWLAVIAGFVGVAVLISAICYFLLSLEYFCSSPQMIQVPSETPSTFERFRALQEMVENEEEEKPSDFVTGRITTPNAVTVSSSSPTATLNTTRDAISSTIITDSSNSNKSNNSQTQLEKNNFKDTRVAERANSHSQMNIVSKTKTSNDFVVETPRMIDTSEESILVNNMAAQDDILEV